MKHRFMNLLSANAKRGTFRADASTNTIELYDIIVSSEAEASWFGGVSLQAVARALDGMAGDVHLRINSPGGDVFAGIAIAQRMREYKGGNIVAHVDGYAASAASIIAIAATKVVMAPASMMMIHKAWTFAWGNSDELLETADLLDKIDGQLSESYAAKGSKSAAEFLDLMAAETWLTPAEATACGLCDELASTGEKESAQARARWDVSAFEHPPASPRVDAAPSAADDAEKAAKAAEESERLQRIRTLQDLLVTAA